MSEMILFASGRVPKGGYLKKIVDVETGEHYVVEICCKNCIYFKPHPVEMIGTCRNEINGFMADKNNLPPDWGCAWFEACEEKLISIESEVGV